MKILPETLAYLDLPAPGERAKARLAVADAGAPDGIASSAVATIEVDAVMPAVVDTLARKLAVATSELLTIVGIPSRTFQRRQSDAEPLKPDETDRLFRVARIASETARVFGDEEKARRWLSTPHWLFEEKAPLSMLGSDAGTKRVEEELVRIHWGEYA